MWTFAWRNLLTRPWRTILALVGLSVPILGVLGLFSLSNGLRHLVGDTLSQIQGVMVLGENMPSPVFSTIPANVADTIRALPGVRAVAPEIWKIAPDIEGRRMFGRAIGTALTKGGEQAVLSALDQPVIQGQDILAHEGLRSAVFPKAIVQGRFLDARDRGQPHIVISTKTAEDFADRRTRTPKKLGDTLMIGKRPFTIVGLYRTGSMLLDVVIIMDIDVARGLLNFGEGSVSSFYVEGDDPSRNDELSQAIESAVAGVDARGMNEIMANFGEMMGQLDTFLLMTVSLALLVGVVGIVNTMLMSTTERYGEFGVLRTNGWSRANLLALVTAESAYLGLLAGLVGCALAMLGTASVNPFISGGLRLRVGPGLLALGLGLSIVMGASGGLFPAWRASRLVPMEAIRRGTR